MSVTVTADVFFNVEQDAAAIRFNGTYHSGFATTAINQALGVLYNNPTPLKFYQYEVWNGYDCLGLLWTGSMDIDDGSMGDIEIRSLFDKIVQENLDAAHTGDLTPIYGIDV